PWRIALAAFHLAARFVNRKSPIAISNTLFLGGPTLFHQSEQMNHRLFVSFSTVAGQLVRSLVEHRRHFIGFLWRASQRHQLKGELLPFHGRKMDADGARAFHPRLSEIGRASCRE